MSRRYEWDEQTGAWQPVPDNGDELADTSWEQALQLDELRYGPHSGLAQPPGDWVSVAPHDQPGLHLVDAVAQYPDGRLWLEPGVHYWGDVDDQPSQDGETRRYAAAAEVAAGFRLYCAPGAVIRGSMLLDDSWTDNQDGSFTYDAEVTVRCRWFFPNDGTQTSRDGEPRAGLYSEDLYGVASDGTVTRFKHVDAAPGEGEWTFDYTTGEVLLGEDPAGYAELHLTVADGFIRSPDADDVHVVGGRFEFFANPAESAVIEHGGGLVEYVEVRHAHGLGVAVDSGMLRWSRFDGCGQGGWTVGGPVLVEYCETTDAAWAYNPEVWAHTATVTGAGAVTRRCWQHDNAAAALHISGDDTIAEEHLLEGCEGAGIIDELATASTIRSNLIRDCGDGDWVTGWVDGAGVVVVDSVDTEVAGNVIIDCAGGIAACQDDRGVLAGLWAHHNDVTLTGDGGSARTGFVVVDPADNTTLRGVLGEQHNQFEANTYRVPENLEGGSWFGWFNHRWDTPAWSVPVAYGVDPSFNPADVDVVIATTDDPNSVILANPPGTVFLFEAGVHRLTAPLDYLPGNRYYGEPGAILSGAKVLTGWTNNGDGRWYVDGQTQRLQVNDWAQTLPTAPRANRAEDLFVDDVRFTHVDTDAVGPGEYHFDYDHASGGRIWLGEDPTGKVVETCVVERAVFGFETEDVEFRNLIVEKFGSPADEGALHMIQAGRGWRAINCEVRLCHGTGITVGDGGVVDGCHAHDNGQFGVQGHGEDIEVTDTRWNDNGGIGYDPMWAAGGCKFAFTTGLRIRRVEADGNAGVGIWVDIDNDDGWIDRCYAHDNALMGIFWEISYRGTIRYNLSVDNGTDADWWGEAVGLQISSSEGVLVYGNTLDGLLLLEADRVSDTTGDRYFLRDVAVFDNDVNLDVDQYVQLISQVDGTPAYEPEANIRFDRNRYRSPVPALGQYWAVDNNFYTFTDWQAEGFDGDGYSLDESDPDPVSNTVLDVDVDFATWQTTGNDRDGEVTTTEFEYPEPVTPPTPPPDVPVVTPTVETIGEDQYEYRGLRFGAGTDYPIRREAGLGGFTARTADRERPRGDGWLPGPSYVAGRIVELEFLLIGSDDLTVMEHQLDQLLWTFTPTGGVEHELLFRRPGRDPQMIRCEPTIWPREQRAVDRIMSTVTVTLRASDPRIYSAAERTVRVPASGVTGGADYPGDYPKEVQTGARGAIAHNAGRSDAFPYIAVYGPTAGSLTRFQLINDTNGSLLDVETTLTTGNLLVADMTARVLGNGNPVLTVDGGSRYGAWKPPRDPFYLSPGDNMLRFVVTGSPDGAACVLTYRDTSKS